jgi:hypothetical protein
MTVFCLIYYYSPDDGHLWPKHIAIKYNLNIDWLYYFILYCCVDGNFIIIRGCKTQQDALPKNKSIQSAMSSPVIPW